MALRFSDFYTWFGNNLEHHLRGCNLCALPLGVSVRGGRRVGRFSMSKRQAWDLNECVSRIQPSTDPSKALADMLDCVNKVSWDNYWQSSYQQDNTLLSRPPSSWLITTTKTAAIAPWGMQQCRPSKRTTQPHIETDQPSSAWSSLSKGWPAGQRDCLNWWQPQNVQSSSSHQIYQTSPPLTIHT